LATEDDDTIAAQFRAMLQEVNVRLADLRKRQVRLG
jgi:hypothetical protein